jgi:prenylcysteine oxidase / farnesylcysteine lyase
MELGASIFVKANKNLWRATEEFNLSLVDFGDEDGEMGIWDGAEFRFRVSRDYKCSSLSSPHQDSFVVQANQKNGGFSWWDMARLLWRYGIDAPRRSESMYVRLLVRQMCAYMCTVYPE